MSVVVTERHLFLTSMSNFSLESDLVYIRFQITQWVPAFEGLLELGLLQAYSFYSDSKSARGKVQPFMLMMLIFLMIFIEQDES